MPSVRREANDPERSYSLWPGVGAACPQCTRPLFPDDAVDATALFSPVYRHAHDVEVRHAGHAAVQTNRKITQVPENDTLTTRALLREARDAKHVPVGAGVDPGPLVRFVVEVSAATLDLVIARMWLAEAERGRGPSGPSVERTVLEPLSRCALSSASATPSIAERRPRVKKVIRLFCRTPP